MLLILVLVLFTTARYLARPASNKPSLLSRITKIRFPQIRPGVDERAATRPFDLGLPATPPASNEDTL